MIPEFKLLRDMKIIHRDLKLENILLGSKQLSVGDYGVSIFQEKRLYDFLTLKGEKIKTLKSQQLI